MASYLLGLGLLAQGRDLNVNGFWNMNKDDAWNIAHGNAPSKNDLIAARRTNAALAAMTAAIMYFIGRRLTNWVGGVITGLIQGFHPLVLDTSTRAWGDTSLVFFIALSALAIMHWGARPTWPRAVLIGIFLGLGASAKLSPLLLSLPLALMGLSLLGIYLWSSRRIQVASRGFQLMAVPFTALATFTLSYPYLWRNPATHLYRLYAFRLNSFDSQGNAFPQARVTGVPDAMRRMGGELGSSFSVSGLLASKLANLTGLSLPGWTDVRSWDLAITFIGILLIGNLIWRWGLLSSQTFVVTFLIGQAVFVLIAMGVEYARYFLPLTLTISMSMGLVLVRCGSYIGRAVIIGSKRGRTLICRSSGHRSIDSSSLPPTA